VLMPRTTSIFSLDAAVTRSPRASGSRGRCSG
jgi:hypothetical protein